jgi:hypothetical protein
MGGPETSIHTSGILTADLIGKARNGLLTSCPQLFLTFQSANVLDDILDRSPSLSAPPNIAFLPLVTVWIGSARGFDERSEWSRKKEIPFYQLFRHQSTLRLSLQALGVPQFTGAASLPPSMREPVE